MFTKCTAGCIIYIYYKYVHCDIFCLIHFLSLHAMSFSRLYLNVCNKLPLMHSLHTNEQINICFSVNFIICHLPRVFLLQFNPYARHKSPFIYMQYSFTALSFSNPGNALSDAVSTFIFVSGLWVWHI